MPETMLVHFIAAGVLLARGADLGSTYLATPNLVLEANDLVRRFRWPFAFATLALCFVPYLNPGFGIIVLVTSLFVSAGNLRQVWLARAVGESEYLAFLRAAAARSTRFAVLGSMLGSALLVGFAGAVMLFFYPTPSWGRSIAFGVLGYAGAIGVHGMTFARRLFVT